MVLLLHHSRGLGAVKVLTVSLALLGVKDGQDLLAVPLRAIAALCMYCSHVFLCSTLLWQKTFKASLLEGHETHCHSVRLGLSLVSGYVALGFGSDLSSLSSVCLQE